ncbi:methyltransferase domain-containing protein [Peredibacter starrii]|uniref:Methyltransferase domain-containing protein n=1 Tax=Peredibacter starrii TaxID=28202 RepID=A0AAX4HSE1_9BACT|nr:methyltransferase domain-containing protein [Peredibacter starrii]WPU66146.1 methyltransferase domain-containing protein [Peredibacter starrii]
MSKTDFPYLHGFSETEQNRLRAQAEFAEYTIFQNINFSNAKKVLEVGCGVGAQTEILLRRFPKVHVTGVDLNEKQLDAAKKFIGGMPAVANRYEFHKMSGDNLSFDAQTFDAAYLCWILEHVPNPAQVLSEVRRVLRPGAEIVVTEVMNSSFFLDPYSPNVWKYWMAFNDYQYDHAGDPFIGAKLGNLLTQVGYHQVRTEVKTWHFDNRQPALRKQAILFWTDLLLSAADKLVEEKYVDQEVVTKTKEELGRVANDPNAVFLYSFMQAKAQVYF